jgi:2,3-bisphosphoglycerate-independent phosphoglycerate mutase
MKYVIIIPDGLGDEPQADLKGLTPLELASTPAMDSLSIHGRCGTATMTPTSQPADPTTTLLAVMGFSPDAPLPGGGPLEAVGLGAQIEPECTIFRCSLTTLIDGILADPMGGGITTNEAERLILDINRELSGSGFELVPGRTWRHLLVSTRPMTVRTTPPGLAVGRPVRNVRPRGKDANELIDYLAAARDILAHHEINAVRRDLGESMITDLWPWSPGLQETLPIFPLEYGLEASAVSCDPLFSGMTRRLGLKPIDVPFDQRYTESVVTDLGRAAVVALAESDLVCVYLDTPYRASLAGMAEEKVDAIEAIDARIVAPLLKALSDHPQWRMMVAPSFSADCRSRRITGADVPFVVSGHHIETLLHQPFNEISAIESDLHIPLGHELMEYFLTVR